MRKFSGHTSGDFQQVHALRKQLVMTLSFGVFMITVNNAIL